MSNDNLVLGKYVIGKQSVVGDPRRKWEDRAHISLVERSHDEPLLVGIVADGVGSADFGARGAQLTIDTVLQVLEQSRGDDIPALIERAVETANKKVYGDNQENEGDGLSTLVVMVIYRGRCYVGNVGDSRAYWIRGEKKKILQLTRDHSYYNIYGGDPDASNAGVVVNAIGNKPEVQVDLGFYLEPGIEKEKAYRLGYAGVPLQPGDAIVLCSDGLIKEDPQGNPYVQMNEIIDAAQSEYETDRAAIKMVSRAEGRRPDDNVSAVTIQYLLPETIKQMASRTERAQRQRVWMPVVGGVLAVIVFMLIGFMAYQLRQKPTEIFLTLTPVPTMTATQPIDPGKARVDQVNGNGASVSVGQFLDTGSSVFSSDEGVKVVIGDQTGKAGVIYLFGKSAMQLNFADKMIPMLQTGALYIQPGSGSADVQFEQWSDVKARVSGSRMIVEIQDDGVWIYCFEGECQLFVGDQSRTVPVGSKRVYWISSRIWEEAMELPYDERWEWNVKCNFCMFEIIPTPTPTATVAPAQPQPTKKPKDSYGSGFNWDDRFAIQETQRKNIAFRGNSFFSIIFTASLLLMLNFKSLEIQKIIGYAGIFTLLIFLMIIL